jgi:hypothetical protein
MGCYNSELPIGPPGPTGPQGPAGELPYKIYTALLTQSGETALTAIELENTLGVTPVWSYNSIGNYQLTANGLFLASKTVVFMGSPYDDPATINFFGQANRLNDNVINVFTFKFILTPGGDQITIEPQNFALNNCPIEIRVYP